jgi:hypothetical protein
VTPGFSLSRPEPYPVTQGSFIVQFSLSSSEPAELLMFDITGREVHRQAVSLGAGAHAVIVNMDPALKQGLYLLQLRQGGRDATTKVHYVR